MSAPIKAVRPLVFADVSRLTFIPVALVRSDDNLTRISLDRVLRGALADDLNRANNSLTIDIKKFRKKSKRAKTVGDVVKAVSLSGTFNLTQPASAVAPSPISRATASEAVVATLRNQLSLAGPVKESDKLSKWKFSPITLAHFASMTNAYFKNTRKEKLVPPMRLSDISAAQRVSDLVNAVDAKNTVPV